MLNECDRGTGHSSPSCVGATIAERRRFGLVLGALLERGGHESAVVPHRGQPPQSTSSWHADDWGQDLEVSRVCQSRIFSSLLNNAPSGTSSTNNQTWEEDRRTDSNHSCIAYEQGVGEGKVVVPTFSWIDSGRLSVVCSDAGL